MICPYLLVILLLSTCEALKILVFYPCPSYSHQRGIMALTERLVSDGHELFVISPNAVPGLEKHINYTYIDVSFLYQYVTNKKKSDPDALITFHREITKWQYPAVWKELADFGRKQLMSDAFRQFSRDINSKEIKFDLIIVENFFYMYACALRSLAEAAPIIAMSSSANDFLAEGTLGSIEHSSFQPSISSEFTDRMSLWQKLDNWISHYYIVSSYKKNLRFSVRRYCRDVFGPGGENIADDCESQISLSLILSNPMYYYPRTLGPNVIEIGPLHLKTPEKLPQNLQQWLDGAEKGVIYFSLGGNMQSRTLPENVLANFLKIFAELQPLGYRILWKWEVDGTIPGQSRNILAQKWIPQEKILAHPKVKMFITQAGVQSFQETVHYGVPTVGIPWFYDQRCNVAKMVNAGIGVQLLPDDLDSYEMIKSAIEEVLFNDKYTFNMKRHSAISHDFTSRGMDQAVFWVEHVAKHGGASRLRPSTADATLFEYLCWDIISVILLFSFLLTCGVYFLLKRFMSFIGQKFESKIKAS